MTMMFEVEDLAVASPATVSRCGMVYMEPTSLGLKPLLDSWLQSLFDGVSEHAALLTSLFDALVPDLIHYVRRHTKETVTTVDNNLCVSCFRMLDALVLQYKRTEPDVLDDETREAIAACTPQLMLFSIVWSVGASCDKASRPGFDKAMRDLVNSSRCALLSSPVGLVAADGRKSVHRRFSCNAAWSCRLGR